MYASLKACSVAVVYSSKAGVWSGAACVQQPGDLESGFVSGRGLSVLAGSALYFMSSTNYRILRYDLCTRVMSILQLPRSRCFGLVMLTTMEDGRLAFTTVEEQSRLCLYSRGDKGFGWSLSKVIELENELPFDGSLPPTLYLVGTTESIGVIFVKVEDELFTIDLNTSRARKVYQGSSITMVVPYMNFYIPVLGAPSTNDGSKVRASSGLQTMGFQEKKRH
ncbi:hypothetical protein EJB05_14029, partial [Eragrostis curvula]